MRLSSIAIGLAMALALGCSPTTGGVDGDVACLYADAHTECNICCEHKYPAGKQQWLDGYAQCFCSSGSCATACSRCPAPQAGEVACQNCYLLYADSCRRAACNGKGSACAQWLVCSNACPPQ